MTERSGVISDCEHPKSHRVPVGSDGHMWCGDCGSISTPEESMWWAPTGWEKEDRSREFLEEFSMDEQLL